MCLFVSGLVFYDLVKCEGGFYSHTFIKRKLVKKADSFADWAKVGLSVQSGWSDQTLHGETLSVCMVVRNLLFTSLVACYTILTFHTHSSYLTDPISS